LFQIAEAGKRNARFVGKLGLRQIGPSPQFL
jgi:hypothetical protein